MRTLICLIFLSILSGCGKEKPAYVVWTYANELGDTSYYVMEYHPTIHDPFTGEDTHIIGNSAYYCLACYQKKTEADSTCQAMIRKRVDESKKFMKRIDE